MTDLFPDGDYTFRESAGEYQDECGETHWPALLRIEIDKRKAWDIMRMLTIILSDDERIDEDGRLIAQLTFVGTIERHDENGNRIAMGGAALSEGEAQS